MKQLTSEFIIKALNINSDSRMVHQVFTGVTTDTRKENKDTLFIALKGENFDAHDFLQKAKDSGCTAALCHKKDIKIPEGFTVFYVKDTLLALQDLAKAWRNESRAKIIGITGTNGKTSTKDFCYQILSSRLKTYCTKGNLNNFIGLPMSLLSLKEEHDVGIFEMGLSVPGEMKTLATIANADIVAVTSVGRAHLQGLGSVEGVAQNKEEIYKYSKQNATKIFNLDNPYTRKMFENAGREGEKITFSIQNPEANVHFKERVSTLDFLDLEGHIDGEPGRALVPVFGRHNVGNLMCASALALAAGLTPKDIWQALPKCKGYWGRNQVVNLKSGAKALFDAYNANPESVAALLENVSRINLSGKLIGIFGEMLELGDHAYENHYEWGQNVGRLPFEHVVFIGPNKEAFTKGCASSGFKKNLIVSEAYEDLLATRVRDMLKNGDTVLLKGSRGMKLERALNQLDPLDFTDKPTS